MPKTKRERIDYMPGPAAVQAMDAAAKLVPKDRPQDLIDRLVIIGASALAVEHWKPPQLYGVGRDQWRLPDELKRLL